MAPVRIAVALLGISASAVAQPAPQRPACSLHVHITDEDGGPIDKAFVLIHSESGAKSDQQIAPDRSGKFKTNLHSGLYALFVSSAGFMPVAQVVDLRSCKPLDINLMMTIDAEHMETGF
jgi:hypothetical protein